MPGISGKRYIVVVFRGRGNLQIPRKVPKTLKIKRGRIWRDKTPSGAIRTSAHVNYRVLIPHWRRASGVFGVYQNNREGLNRLIEDVMEFQAWKAA